MKILTLTLIILSSINSCFSNGFMNAVANIEVDDSIDVSPIKKLTVNQKYYYKTYRTSCKAGDLLGTMDSICIYRDSVSVKIKYMDKVYSLDELKINDVSQIEIKILSIQHSTRTSYINYIIKEGENEGLLGDDDGTNWKELIELITSWT
jgi:hypothetical protein